MEDREIIARCQAGETHLVDLLIERYQVPLYSLCRKLARDRSQADDLFQDTWLRMLKGIDGCDPERRFAPWLFAICVNRYRDGHRRRRRWLPRLQPWGDDAAGGSRVRRIPHPGPDPGEEVQLRERVAAVRRALDGLADIHRLPVLLHYFRHLSMEEIGEVLGVPGGTVKSRLAAARARLRAALGDLDDE